MTGADDLAYDAPPGKSSSRGANTQHNMALRNKSPSSARFLASCDLKLEARIQAGTEVKKFSWGGIDGPTQNQQITENDGHSIVNWVVVRL